MKYLGIPIFALALVAGILPQFTDCAGLLNLANGMTAPMRCHWTAVAEIALAVPLGAIGAMMFFSKTRENGRSLSILAGILGVFVALIPTTLIGVCKSNMMACRNLMLPALVISGVLIVVASVIFFTSTFRKTETAA
jgi:hypothetical protein